MERIGRHAFRTLLVVLSVLFLPATARPQPPQPPTVSDPRLTVTLVAAAPDIVHPIALDVDSRGRVFVIESHTHFPPAGYKGPKHDRVRLLEDTDGDGKADRITTFFEGVRHAMDLAIHPDGSIYLATRNEILRLRDTKGTGQADEKQRIVFLDTKGDYPHNGLSGLCFDSKGNLFFGMGENLGASYKLQGSDRTTFAGEGDGGHIFWCTADGKGLRRVATGFWNPFGICRDIFGRVFTVDNDPDSMPPCRLLHVVEGGDYGFQFRYGRSGRHPFQSWNGELPGTLPMMSGVGEGPCEVLSYESHGLPREYLGNLFVTAWADHRVERYVVKPKGASFTAERKPFVQGGADFRPVGLAVAPDGSLFLSDWVLRDYTLHNRGAIWHIRPTTPSEAPARDNPRKALFHLHRPVREWAARELAKTDEGKALLVKQLAGNDVRVQAAALTALVDAAATVPPQVLRRLSESDGDPGLAELALQARIARGDDVRDFLKGPLKAHAIAGMRDVDSASLLLKFAHDPDPFVRHAAAWQLGRTPALLAKVQPENLSDPKIRLAALLARRFSGKTDWPSVAKLLGDGDDDVRFLAAKWVADEQLSEARSLLAASLKDPKLNIRMYWAFATALARLDGKQVDENRLADLFAQRALDDKTSPAARALALQLVPAKRLTLAALDKMISSPDRGLSLEAVRALAEHPDEKRIAVLLGAMRNASLPDDVRCHAILSLATHAPDHAAEFVSLAVGDNTAVRQESLRALAGVKLSADQRATIGKLASLPESADLALRVLGKKSAAARPPVKDTAAWLKLLGGPADVAAGRRIFAHPRLATCARCHRAEGRGADVGPDLSVIGRTERRHLLESILQPSTLVAPHFQAWLIETADGKTRTGMLTRTYLDEYTYLDEKGGSFKVNTRDVVTLSPLTRSIMPDGLVDSLTDQELRDLLAYLESRK